MDSVIPSTAGNKVRWALQALNFFMADLQAGIGPFLSIFLLSLGWQSGAIGTVLTLGGAAGMLMTAPVGALIDATSRKRSYIIASAVFTSLAAGIILFTQNFWLVAVSQVATAIAGSVIGPAVVGITLGIAKQKGFTRQNGLNQAFNHGGNVAAAALSGFLGMKYGLPAIIILSACFAVLSIISVLAIPAKAIDDKAARGLKEDGEHDEKATGLSVLLTCKPLLILAAALGCFHLGNAALLPMYGMAAAANNQSNPMMFVAMTIIIAQVTMVIVSLLAMRMAETKGYWLVLLISFIALPIRGFVASEMIGSTGIYPVQILDGIGAGLQSVAVPGLVARILNGSGRINVGQGAVMTVQNLGAALSPAIGGWLAQGMGYPKSFLVLGSFATLSIILWSFYHQSLKKVCDNQQPV